MSKKKCIDFLGQEVKIGDWAVVTQNNSLYIGKVVKAGASVTIAVDSEDEFIKTDSKFGRLSWQDKKIFMTKRFGPKSKWFPSAPRTFARDGKFIKITPTEEMLMNYDKS